MRVSVEAKKREAIARMKEYGVFSLTIKDFEKDGLVSESAPPIGACFWLSDEQKERVRKFEEEHNALVYHVIHCYMENVGEVECYLFVSDYPEEWGLDRANIVSHKAFAYVYNCDMPLYSEFGDIGIKLSPAAGLARIW